MGFHCIKAWSDEQIKVNRHWSKQKNKPMNPYKQITSYWSLASMRNKKIEKETSQNNKHEKQTKCTRRRLVPCQGVKSGSESAIKRRVVRMAFLHQEFYLALPRTSKVSKLYCTSSLEKVDFLQRKDGS